MLIGKKTKGVMKPGYIYVPYIMSKNTTTIIQIKNYFRKSKIRRLLGMPSADSMIKSRYATKRVNSNFYSTIDKKKPLK